MWGEGSCVRIMENQMESDMETGKVFWDLVEFIHETRVWFTVFQP